jgi:hypothetical protein
MIYETKRVVSHIQKFGDPSKSPVGDVSSSLEMHIPPALISKSAAEDVIASPNCGICNTAEKRPY